MLSFTVPDHFGISMLLLVMALYISGKCIQKGRQLTIVQTVLLFVFTAGVSLNNGLKIFMDALFVNGKRFFRPKYLLLAVILPAALMWGFARWEYHTFVWPKEMARKEVAKNALERQRQHVIKAFRDTTRLKDTAAIRKGYERILAQRDSVRAARKAQRAVNRHSGKPMMEGEFMRWTDVTTPRWPSLVENVFGESIQLHEDHLLGDTLRSRPVIVKYNYWINYIVEILIVVLFLDLERPSPAVPVDGAGRHGTRFLLACGTGIRSERSIYHDGSLGVRDSHCHGVFAEERGERREERGKKREERGECRERLLSAKLFAPDSQHLPRPLEHVALCAVSFILTAEEGCLR